MSNFEKLLKEIKALEGVNVEYMVAGFAGALHLFHNDRWKEQYYCIGGGTRIDIAFKEFNGIIKKEHIDGKKILIILTDGDVSEWQIRTIEKTILKSTSEVRCMIIGIGSETSSLLVKTFGYNILTMGTASAVIADAIIACLN